MFIVSQLHLCPESAESGQFCDMVQVNSVRFNTHTHNELIVNVLVTGLQ